MNKIIRVIQNLIMLLICIGCSVVGLLAAYYFIKFGLEKLISVL